MKIINSTRSSLVQLLGKIQILVSTIPTTVNWLPNGDTNKKAKEGKKDEAPESIVLKVDMHYHECASRVNKCVRGFDGVETVKVDWN